MDSYQSNELNPDNLSKDDGDIDLQDVARVGYADMLHDDARNKKYLAAINATVESFVNSNIRTLRVVDIGTGTGLLSMMAVRKARELGIPIVVTAFEYFPVMANCARRVIEDNGYTNEITVLGMKSDSHPGFKEEEKADMLITELFDTELIGEGALLSYRHAIQYFMKPKFVAVPTEATVFIQIVESEELIKYNQLHPALLEVMDPSLRKQVSECSGSEILHDLQMSQLDPAEDFDYLVCDSPSKVFKFDFTSLDGLKLNQEYTMSISSTKVFHTVVLSWWDLKMSEFDDTILSMAPYYKDQEKKEWREHWIQAIYYPKFEFDDNADHYCDNRVLCSRHDEYSFWFSFLLEAEAKPYCDCGFHARLSRNRMLQLNNWERIKPHYDLISLRKPSTILFIGDFSILPMILGDENVKVFCLSDKDLYGTYSLSDLKVVSSTELVTNIDLVVSEPYFSTSDLPSDDLKFWFNVIEDTHLCNLSDEKIFPNKFILKCLLVEFDDLWKIRSEVGSVLGFDLSYFDSLILDASDESDEDFESQPLWEYPGKALMEPITALNFTWSEFKSFYRQNVTISSDEDLAKNSKRNNNGECIKSPNIKLTGVKRETLLVFWTEFFFNDALVLSSGPVEPVQIGSYIKWSRTSKQGISFIPSRLINQAGAKKGQADVNCELKYDFKNRKLYLNARKE